MFCFCVGGKGKRGFLDATFFRGHQGRHGAHGGSNENLLQSLEIWILEIDTSRDAKEVAKEDARKDARSQRNQTVDETVMLANERRLRLQKTLSTLRCIQR